MILSRFSVVFSLFAGVCAACSSGGSPAAPQSSSSGSAGASSAASFGAPSGTVDCSAEPNVDTYSARLEKAGASGAFRFELVSSTPAPPALDNNTFVVRVTGADGDPADGQLSATLDMPEHGHTSPKTPVITFDAATGAFTLDPMYFFMVGLWRVTLTFTATASGSGAAGAADSASPTDSVELRFCVN